MTRKFTKQFSFGHIALYLFWGLLGYMPVHIFLSTWLGTSLGILGLAKVAKDVMLVVGFSLALAAAIKHPGIKDLLKDRLVWLIFIYGALTVLLALARPTDQEAELLGVVYNTRFLLFFLYGRLLTLLFDAKHIAKRSVQVVLAAAAVVLVFGVVQYTILPDDALTHVGYARENGVLPAFFIDDKPDLERIMSTLRDPNSLGSYLIIIGTLAFALLPVRKGKKLHLPPSIFHLLVLLCLWFTFSRSAWLGFIVAAVVWGALSIKRGQLGHRFKRYFVITSLVILAGGAAGLYTVRDSYFVQNVIFHADETTVLEDPNQLRIRFWQESLNDIVANPIGHGPGTAGLASIRNEEQGTVLNENYYLQIAHEKGLIGLFLFLAILVMVGLRLYRSSRADKVALALFASFIGLVVTNFLVHIWANEAVAYTWWGLAGLAIYTVDKQLSPHKI